ncbi:MAG TPA: D-alanyl-D-alanine carboxypeptidase, partial [Gammaproteobacteria bacterium]
MSRASVPVRAMLLLVGLVAGRAHAQTAAPPSVPPKLAFKSHYVIDFATETPLVANAPDLQLPPASLTKLMTAYVVFGALESGRMRLD